MDWWVVGLVGGLAGRWLGCWVVGLVGGWINGWLGLIGDWVGLVCWGVGLVGVGKWQVGRLEIPEIRQL